MRVVKPPRWGYPVLLFLFLMLSAGETFALEASDSSRQEQAVSRAQLEEKISKNLPPVPVSPKKSPSVPPGMISLLDEIAASPQTNLNLFLGRLLVAIKGDTETLRMVTTQSRDKDVALLTLAAKYDHVDLLQRLLKKYPDYQQVADKFIFDRPIYKAFSNGSIRAVKLLYQAWGSKQQLDRFNDNILSMAVKTGSAELVEYLLTAGERWNSVADGDPVVLAMSLGYPEVARIFMREQGVDRLTDEQANEIFAKAMDDPPRIPVAEALVDFITEARQRDLYYAAAIGNEKIVFALCSLPGIDITAPARGSFFREVETQGRTADEIARAFGHISLAEKLNAKIALLCKQQQRLVVQRRAREEHAQQLKLVQQRNAEKSNRRKTILAQETPETGPLRTAVYYDEHGFWERLEPLDTRYDTLFRLAPKNGFPLRLDYGGNHPDLELYIAWKQGKMLFSATTCEVSLHSGEQKLLHFSLKKRGDGGLNKIAPILLQKLEEEVKKRAELFDTLLAQRNRREIDRVAKLKQSRERQHKETMLSLQQKIREQNYPAALELIDQIDKQGFYQSEKLDLIKATLLHKVGRTSEARCVLELYLVEHADSGSPYFAKAEALLKKLGNN